MAEHAFSSKDTGIIVVDLQADFTELKSGELAVAGTDAKYIDAVEKETRQFLEKGQPVCPFPSTRGHDPLSTAHRGHVGLLFSSGSKKAGPGTAFPSVSR